LYVITLEGWDTSSCVDAEINEALMMGMPVSFIDPKPFIENIMEGDRHDR